MRCGMDGVWDLEWEVKMGFLGSDMVTIRLYLRA
jgi:hypothetical protein